MQNITSTNDIYFIITLSWNDLPKMWPLIHSGWLIQLKLETTSENQTKINNVHSQHAHKKDKNDEINLQDNS